MNKHWNEKLIIESVKQFYKENNRIPKIIDFAYSKYPSHSTVIRYFGSWNKTIEAAGFEPNQWNKEKCIQAIQQFYKENNRIPKTIDFSNNKYPSYRTVIRYFGSWNKAIETAGFEPNKLSKYPQSRNCNKGTIIKSIQQFYKENNRIPKTIDFINNKYIGYSTVIKYFNSWNKAIEAAGFKPNIKNIYGIYTKANDGIIYRSRYEAKFVNKFLFNKYKYIIEPKYPNSNKRYDWYLPELNLYIELDGEIRPEVIKEKIEINKLLNRNLLVIKTKDIDKYNTLEEMILIKCTLHKKN